MMWITGKHSSDVTAVHNGGPYLNGDRHTQVRQVQRFRTASEAGNSLVSFRETYQDVLRVWGFRDGGCLHATKSLRDVRGSYEDSISSVAVHLPFL